MKLFQNNFLIFNLNILFSNQVTVNSEENVSFQSFSENKLVYS